MSLEIPQGEEGVLGRIKRGLYGDRYIEKTYEYPRFRYTIDLCEGDTKTIKANDHRFEDQSMVFMEADDDTWAMILTHHPKHVCKPGLSGWRGFDEIDSVSCIHGWEREQIGRDKWLFSIDRWEHEVVDQIKKFIET